MVPTKNDSYTKTITSKILPKYMIFEKSFSQIWTWRKLKNPMVGGGAVDPKNIKRQEIRARTLFFLNIIQLWQILLLVFNFAFEFLNKNYLKSIIICHINYHIILVGIIMWVLFWQVSIFRFRYVLFVHRPELSIKIFLRILITKL